MEGKTRDRIGKYPKETGRMMDEVTEMEQELAEQNRIETERYDRWMAKIKEDHRIRMEARRDQLIAAYNRLCKIQGTTPVTDPDLDDIEDAIDYANYGGAGLSYCALYSIQEAVQRLGLDWNKL